MVQFKGLILVSLVIITLNSCFVGDSEKKEVLESGNKPINDTISVSASQYEVIIDSKGVFDIKLRDEKLIEVIEKSTAPIFKVEIENKFYYAKGNDVLSSHIPDNCDYFYFLTSENKVFVIDSVLNLREIEYLKSNALQFDSL